MKGGFGMGCWGLVIGWMDIGWIQGLADVALELALYIFLVKEAMVDDGRTTGSFSEVLFSTMKVSPSFFKVFTFAGDVFRNAQRDVHRE
eukprot:14174131-Ditylum_brightwellii.AAC.1